jgi:hypothetical protein
VKERRGRKKETGNKRERQTDEAYTCIR